jgi:DNA-3-methyladenine glycosylase I
MAPALMATPPKTDSAYLDRMSQVIFSAGLNWRMVEKKWPEFQKSFASFSPVQVAGLSEADIKALMNNPCIIRNERKIRATIQNAKTILNLQREYGSVKGYIDSVGKLGKDRLQKDLQMKFKQMGPSTARMFLVIVGYPLMSKKDVQACMDFHRG